MAQWGTGQWGGMQNCGYPTSAAPGASNVSDEARELQQKLSDAKKELSTKKTEKKRVERELEKARKDVTDVMQSGYADFVLNHIENGRQCENYHSARPVKTTPFKADEWDSVCLSGAGAVSSEVCSEYRDSDSKVNANVCAKALPIVRRKSAELEKIDSAIQNLNRTVADLGDDLKEAKKNPTEGSVCLECLQRNNGYQAQSPQTNWTGVAANVGLGLASMYAGYQTNKTIAQYNSNLGYATQPTSTLGYGYPYFAAAAYGAMGSGIGQGGFGCGSGIGGTGNMNGYMGMSGPYGSGSLYGGTGGAFGYPQNMMGLQQMGGGMYNTGLGSWGMAGPWGSSQQMTSMYPGLTGYGYSNMGLGYSGAGTNLNSMQMQLAYMMSRIQSLQYGSGLYTNSYGSLTNTGTYSTSGSITGGSLLGTSSLYPSYYPTGTYSYPTTAVTPLTGR